MGKTRVHESPGAYALVQRAVQMKPCLVWWLGHSSHLSNARDATVGRPRMQVVLGQCTCRSATLQNVDGQLLKREGETVHCIKQVYQHCVGDRNKVITKPCTSNYIRV